MVLSVHSGLFCLLCVIFTNVLKRQSCGKVKREKFEELKGSNKFFSIIEFGLKRSNKVKNENQ